MKTCPRTFCYNAYLLHLKCLLLDADAVVQLVSLPVSSNPLAYVLLADVVSGAALHGLHLFPLGLKSLTCFTGLLCPH